MRKLSIQNCNKDKHTRCNLLYNTNTKQKKTNDFKLNPKKWLETIMNNPSIQGALGYKTRIMDIPSNIKPMQENSVLPILLR